MKELNDKSMTKLQVLLSSPNSPVAAAEAMDSEHQAAQKRQQGFFQNILNGELSKTRMIYLFFWDLLGAKRPTRVLACGVCML